MKHLVVGSTSPKTAEYYKELGLSKSILFTNEFTDANVYHTSLADCWNLKEYLPRFDKIYWANPDISEFNNFTEWFGSLHLLKQFSAEGINDDPYNIQQKFTVNNTETAAIYLGCSHTAGVGLNDPLESYTQLVSTCFALSSLNLSESGRGNFRSFDLFKKINFFKNQVVVLQLTDIARIRYFVNDLPGTELIESQLANTNKSYISVHNDKQLLFNTLEHIEFVVQLARLNNLQFVFFNLGGNPDLDDNPEKNQLKNLTEYYLQDYREYIPDVLSQNIDRGNDNLHFGPRSQAIWAKLIINKIEKLYQ